MFIRKKVEQLVKKYNTNDPFELADKLHINIVFEPLGSIQGYYSRSHRTKVIHINDTLSPKKRLFTCSHEMGHAILHPNENTSFLKSQTLFSTDKLEQEANLFALELLLSREVFQPITVAEAKEEYGIPEQLLHKNFYP
ncbi:ImmA/IrrE family metallo-endopeptidase [Gracilibacillus marinus]|uniref:ImmA/IrrE family metallo-endopeptidase n=1 Tax=Gracilibacillus marinus TaxID=630535 RepID=A0ABV8VW85_9BACI